MRLFGAKPEARQQPEWTLRGNRVVPSTNPISRRFSLWAECLRVLEGQQGCRPQDHGVPLGDGCGLERLVETITPTFRLDAALLPWVALRGALASLHVETMDPTSRSLPFHPAVETAMGVGDVSGPADPGPRLGVAPEWEARLSPCQQDAAKGIFAAVVTRLQKYPEFAALPQDEVRSTPGLLPSPAVALDMIAWAGAALLRTEMADGLIAGVTEPDRMDVAGWYVEPLWNKSERYWDGRDWTARCRLPGTADEIPLPL